MQKIPIFFFIATFELQYNSMFNIFFSIHDLQEKCARLKKFVEIYPISEIAMTFISVSSDTSKCRILQN